MNMRFLTGFIATAAVFATFPAHATDWSEQMNVCAAAVQSEGLAAEGEYLVTFVDARGSRVKRLTIELTPDDGGDTMTATCNIKRGEVTEVVLTS
ncbi:MAG: hypothetical protein DHS20C05_00090 [Hyphococcus sp.]|nr:MAG: hypothetical protein DHS20C05_00090 [Marinicaulis sp.]